MKDFIFPKIVDRIKNRNNGREEFTGMFDADTEMTAYHVSSEKMQYLAHGQALCLYPSIPYGNSKLMNGTVVSEQYVYAVTIPKGSPVHKYGDHEYRVIILDGFKGEIIGLQQMIRLNKESYDPRYSRNRGQFLPS